MHQPTRSALYSCTQIRIVGGRDWLSERLIEAPQQLRVSQGAIANGSDGRSVEQQIGMARLKFGDRGADSLDIRAVEVGQLSCARGVDRQSGPSAEASRLPKLTGDPGIEP
jgi:hypothetical protein